MRAMDVIEIRNAINGKIRYWKDEVLVTSVVNYYEQPKKGSLFLIDEMNDEDKLIERLKNSQVSGVLVKPHYGINLKKWRALEIGVIEIESLRQSYLALAKYYRTLFDIPMIEVIGSSGKTTTKEIIGCVLNEKYKTLVGYENYNAPSGVAYNLLNLDDHHEACVLEVGMKGYGIMDLSSGFVKPNIAVVTSIQRAHMVDLGSIENIIKAKSELFNHLDKNSMLLINGDDVNCLNMPIDHFKGKLYTFGLTAGNDFYASNIKYDQGITYFDVELDSNIYTFAINTFGKYNVSNALAAIIIGHLFNVPINKIKKGLLTFIPIKGRQEEIRGINYSTIINDNFNANPDSTEQLIQELPIIAYHNPLVLVLGDLERPSESIEEYARKIHYELGQQVAQIKFRYLILIGKWAIEIKKAVLDQGIDPSKIYYFETVDKALNKIEDLIPKNSVVVFKAQKAYVNCSPLINRITL